MRTFLFLASLVSLSWARTLLVQTEDEAGIVRGSLNRIVTTKAPIAQIDELFEEPISIYSEYEDNEVSDKDHIDEQAQILELISTILSPPELTNMTFEPPGTYYIATYILETDHFHSSEINNAQ